MIHEMQNKKHGKNIKRGRNERVETLSHHRT